MRAAAIAALRETGRGDAAAYSAVLRGLSDPQRAVRIASLLTLVEQGGTSLTAGDLARFRFVAGEFSAWSQVNLHDSELQRAQGIVQLLAGDINRAADALQIALDLDPGARSGRFFLALARIGQQRLDDARTLFKQVPKDDPFYARAQEQLARIRD
jgi:predicted Zn-dependent protease